ncbi:MAG: SusD/RagB family nutrient-binding outer membrane lipoprotein, partial [Bacteroidota bacterium]|nr:SusD/RagB family nutrient-binding outer membrane lipoprotein [Bacteroidota bacterium]
MKLKIYLPKLLLAMVILSLQFSCTDEVMDKINNNPDNAKDVTAKFLLSDVETSTAFNVVGSDLSFFSSVYIEHEVGTYNQLWDAETRSTQPTTSSTYDNPWKSIYQNLLNAKKAIAKCSAGGDEA